MNKICQSLMRSAAISMIAAGMVSFSTAVSAQDVEPDRAEEDGDRLIVDPILVTAERRTTALEDTPITMTVFGAADLEARQIDSGVDLIKATPGLIGGNNIGNSTAGIFFVRGLGQDDTSPLVDPAVGIYLDDVYLARAYSNNMTLYDIEQVEVLKGPQGVLYGRNTTGGAIRYTTRKPNEEFGGYIEGELGNFDTYGLKANVNFPLAEQVFVSANAFTYQRDEGFIKNITTGEDSALVDQLGGRMAIRILPSAETMIDFFLEQTRSDTPGDTGANILRPTSSLFETESGLEDPFSEIETFRTGLTVAYSGNNFTIKSITAYERPQWEYMLDFSGEPTPVFILFADYQSDIYSQEFQVSADYFDNRLETTYGVFGFYETGDNLDGQNLFNGLIVNENEYENTTRSVALYGQARFNITDRLSVSGGLRYTDETRELDMTGFSVGADGSRTVTFTNEDILAAGNSTELNTSKLTPKLGIEYNLAPDVLLYGSYTEGFRSGSFNQRAFNAADLSAFDPEEVKAYEAGLKGVFFDQRMRGSLSVYRNDYENFIVNQINPNTGNFVTANAAEVRVQGVEADVSFRATRDLTLRAAVSYMDAEYLELEDGVGIPESNEVRFTPPVTANIGMDWDIPISDFEPRFSANYFHSDAYFVGLGNNDSERVDELGLLDLQFSFRPTEALNLSLFCKNCTDEAYITTAVSAAILGFETQTIGNPQTYGIRLRYDY